MTRETRWSRIASIALACLVILANMVALGMLVHVDDREELVRRAAARGRHAGVGHQRHRVRPAVLGARPRRSGRPAGQDPQADGAADWRFSQDENHDAVEEVAASASKNSGWIPTFVDYLYVSLTNSSAFSPTDTMPLSARAKVLMGIEATAALLTSLLVIARAVGSLGG